MILFFRRDRINGKMTKNVLYYSPGGSSMRRMLIAVMTVLSLSCASAGYVSRQQLPASAGELKDRKVGVALFPLEFQHSPTAGDPAAIEKEIGGKPVAVRKEFLSAVNDGDLGKVGIIYSNALGYLKTPADKIMKSVQSMWMKGLSAKKDYRIPANPGILSNALLRVEPGKQPADFPFDRSKPVPQLYSGIKAVKEAVYLPQVNKDGLQVLLFDYKVDLVMAGSLDLGNDLVEVIEPSDAARGSGVKAGAYFMRIHVLFNFRIFDTRTGNVLVDGKNMKSPFLADKKSFAVPLPIPAGNAEKFNAFFRNRDLSEFLLNALAEWGDRNYHLVAPYCITGR
jgi:hypothetical protein